MMDESVGDLVAATTVEKVPAAEWDWPTIDEGCYKLFGFHPDIPPVTMERLNPDNFRDTSPGEGARDFRRKSGGVR